MAEIKNSELDMSSQQKAELDKEKSKEEKKEAKRAKRQHYRELNEPPKLTVLEEVGNAVTHGIGAARPLCETPGREGTVRAAD